MAYSKIEGVGDGVTDTFPISFTLGFLDRSDVACRVGDEVDGSGDPVYRTLNWINDGLVQVLGGAPGNGVPYVFTRTVSKDTLIHDYSDGEPIIEENLDESNKQIMMLVHEFLDGRITLEQFRDLNGDKLLNVGAGTADTDGVNKGQMDAAIASAVTGGSVVDHGTLSGLTDDDHTQYHTDARGDARYYTQAAADILLNAKAALSHSHAISDVTGLQSALDGKATSSHTHAAADITSGVFDTALLGTGTADSSVFLRGDGTWAVTGGGGGSFSDLSEVTEETMDRNGDDIQRLNFEMADDDMLRINHQGTVGNRSGNTILVKRTANYTGIGTITSWVNSAIRADTTVEATALTNEWCIAGVLNNYAPVGSGGGAGGENCGGYFQGNHYSAGSTWGLAIETNDYDAGGGKSGIAWGSETLLRTDRVHAGNDLFVAGFFTRGLDDSTGTPGKIYAYGLCDSAWYGANIGHADPTALETEATYGWLVGDVETRVAGGAGAVPVDNAFCAFNDGSSGFLDKAGSSKQVGFAAAGTYSAAAFRMEQNANFAWEGTSSVVSTFNGSNIVSNRGLWINDVVSSGWYYAGTGGSPTYGIYFGSQSFAGGYVLYSAAFRMGNDGVMDYAKQGIQLPSVSFAGYYVIRLSGTSAYVPVYN